MRSKSKTKRMKLISSILCLLFIAVAVEMTYLTLQPTDPIENLVKVSGTVQRVSIYHTSGPLGTTELRISLQ
jgi:hypothetical protein